jgi:radical SAM superfamily enzyme YgiQ (UPF0313 family)
MELLLKTPTLLETLIRRHLPGTLKIAPEHTAGDLLQLMHKEPHKLLQQFVKKCAELAQKTEKRVELNPYCILGHPGSTPDHAAQLVQDMINLGLQVRQFQDFTPTPGTLSTAMFVSGLRADNLAPLHIPCKHSEKMKERRIVESAFFRDKKDRKRGKKNNDS